MFPNVKNKDDHPKEKIKQKQWNEGHGKSNIPEYSPIRDKHTGSYKKVLTTHTSVKTKSNDFDTLQHKQAKLKTYFERKLQLMSQLQQLHPDNIQEIRSFEDSMNKSLAPNFYSYFCLLPLKQCQDLKGYLHEENKKIRQKSSSYHRISTAIRARDQCLQRLKKTLLKMKQSQILKIKAELKEEIAHLRLLTSNVIDEIKKWRLQLGTIDEKAIYFSGEQKNYLLELLNDNKFIFNSELSGVINFGEKNDPYIIAPLKKAEEKEKNLYLEILQTQKQLSHYEKYMEYLASQKAYELNVSMQNTQKKIVKSQSVNKIYGTTGNHSKVDPIEEKKYEDEDIKAMELHKNREERLKKNQDKINAIKSIYETFASKKQHPKTSRRIPQTDVQQKRDTFRSGKKTARNMRDSEDNGFDGLVKLKLDFEKVKPKSKKKKQSTSLKKQPNNQQKMIDNLRQIQQTLKSKLQLVQKQNSKLDEGLATSTKFTRKNNQELVKQLKLQIIQKIQAEKQQKQKVKKKKRQQQQKALQQIKIKMKKQMQEKLQLKKKQKIMERQQLEKRLREQQDRLNSQRKLQIQLQLKLNKERQMRQLEKIRRQSLQKQKKYKQQLQKQQNLRRQREQSIDFQRGQKMKLIEQLKKRQLKDQIETQLKKQLLDRKRQQDDQSSKIQFEAIKKQKQSELAKQIQLLKLRQRQQMSVLQKQALIRQKMIKLKQQEQELKRKQVEHLMKKVIQTQKEDIQHQALQKRISLQEQMRNSIKEKMLEQYKAERQNQIQLNRTKRDKEVEEDVYRDKIKQKIQRQMRMDAINKTKQDMDEKQSKKYQVRKKLQNIKSNIQASHVIDKQKIQSDIKKQLIERVIFDKQADRQNAKTALRSQFQRQLLSSAVPQIYETKDSFLLKSTGYLHEDAHLTKKLQANKPTNQRPGSREGQAEYTSKSGFKDVRSLITNQQLQIYSKQKKRISTIKQDRHPQKPKIYQQQEQGFELMNTGNKKNHKGSDDEQYDIKVVRKQKINQQQEKYEKKKNKKKKRKHQKSESEIDSEQQKYQRKKQKSKKKKQQRKDTDEQSSEVDSEDKHEIKRKKKKQIQKKHKKKYQDEDDSYEEKKALSKHKKLNFGTSEDERNQNRIRKSSIKKRLQEDESQDHHKKKVVVHFDGTKKSKDPNFSQIQPITIKKTDTKQKIAQNQSKFTMVLQAIPQDQLDEYIQAHFSNLPTEQLDILTHNREQLYRKLINQLTFCLLLGNSDNKLGGMAIAYHDRSRSDIRKFIIVHVGSYKNEDLKEFILSTTNYIFKKDPCDEIEFHYEIDESFEDRLAFSNDFNKWFDKYGNVYQKKLQNTQYERKYVLKRQFNQKCDVILGGVNKNTFRNIFSVYSGVVMSDADMIQFKQELKDVIAPQDDVSYAIMIAQLFRTYLTPDQAEALKGKVKQFAKLKQLLILVVMLQKKKVKMDQLKLMEFKSLIELNMRLMSQGKDVIRYAKDSGVDLNRVYYCELNHGFNLPFNFQTTSLPVETKQNQIRQISYFRLSPLPPYKLHIIKSSIYNGEMNILPTQNSKYKLFIMNAQQYVEMRERQDSKLDLFMYLRLFLKNVKSHNVAVWKYVWMPEMTDKGAWSVRQFRSFLKKDIYAHDSVNISYRQFLPGALIIQPEHRDLVITPPFIVGIMSMTLQQITQGSPLYARLIDIDALRTLEVEE